jgi:hypothetical protein
MAAGGRTGDLNLERLHGVIQDAMGWHWEHLHEFLVGEMRIGVPDDEGWFRDRVADERQFTLERLFKEPGEFEYVYDFGDSWHHRIVVEEIGEGTGTFAPRCLGGARACPPEDCGGVWGYEDLVKALARPRSKRCLELREWVGDEWTPKAFDVDAADRLVARHQPRPGRGRGGAQIRSRSRARA